MIALLSKDYFSSDWCVHELDLMMERAQGADLIIPIVVHDGDAIPDASLCSNTQIFEAMQFLLCPTRDHCTQNSGPNWFSLRKGLAMLSKMRPTSIYIGSLHSSKGSLMSAPLSRQAGACHPSNLR
jgi:hypothetical protein